ncbi:hypothetical protein YYC_02072 [Plasmodium yoelii 17X]|uniref:Membrane associated histidine-rich protein 1a n=1 Tax=Plasmodium yoelii 17X TaxID=1323249 RepID=V7PNI9_PLAYE|nr:hypothetical protein YYC_02072 [Plasmodium yoelii 17X]
MAHSAKEESKTMHPQDEDPAELSKYIAKESSATFSYLKKAENCMKKFYESYLVPNEDDDSSRENSDEDSEEDKKKNESDDKKEKKKRKKKPQTLLSTIKHNVSKSMTIPNFIIFGFIFFFMVIAYSSMTKHRQIGYAAGFLGDASQRAARPAGCTCGGHKAAAAHK